MGEQGGLPFVARTPGGSNEDLSELLGQEVVTVLEFPADLFGSRGDELAGISLQALRDSLMGSKDRSQVAKGGHNLSPDTGRS